MLNCLFLPRRKLLINKVDILHWQSNIWKNDWKKKIANTYLPCLLTTGNTSGQENRYLKTIFNQFLTFSKLCFVSDLLEQRFSSTYESLWCNQITFTFKAFRSNSRTKIEWESDWYRDLYLSAKSLLADHRLGTEVCRSKWVFRGNSLTNTHSTVLDWLVKQGKLLKDVWVFHKKIIKPYLMNKYEVGEL